MLDKQEATRQRAKLNEIAEFLHLDASRDDSALDGFSHAYHNTIQGHLRQLDAGRFNDPAVMNELAIAFAERYQHNIAAMRAWEKHDPSAAPELHWQKAWQCGRLVEQVPFLPDFVVASVQILIGK